MTRTDTASYTCIGSEDFSVDQFLVEILPQIPLSAQFIGANPSKATSLPTSPFPAQWHDVCSLTLPPNGFSSQPWWNDKVIRKEKWLAWGLPPQYLVPTLYHTYMKTEYVYDESAQDFHQDENGGLALDWPEPGVQNNLQDTNCKSALHELIRSHGRLVMKVFPCTLKTSTHARGSLGCNQPSTTNSLRTRITVHVCAHTPCREASRSDLRRLLAAH